MIVWDGTSQDDRLLEALRPGYVRVDEMRFEEMLAMAADYAGLLEFRGTDNRPAGDWKALFESDETCILAALLATNLELVEAEFLSSLAAGDGVSEGSIEICLDLARKLDGWHSQLSGLDSPESDRAYEKISVVIEQSLSSEFRELCDFLESPEGLIGSISIPQLGPVWHKTGSMRGDGGRTHSEDPKQFLKAVFYSFRNGVLHLQGWARSSLSASLERNDHDPAIGLFIAFLKLFAKVQARLDHYTQRHLDFYYEEVLKLRRREHVPDSALLVFTPDKPGREVWIERGTAFKAGLDENQKELMYETVNEVLVTDATVRSLNTLYLARNPLSFPEKSLLVGQGKDGAGTAYVTSAKVNRIPGNGEAGENGEEQAYPLFGVPRRSRSSTAFEDAYIGFAVASSVLLMKQGERDIVISLSFDPGESGEDLLAAFARRLNELNCRQAVDAEAGEVGMGVYPQTTLKDAFYKAFRHMFNITLTGEQGWFEVDEYFPGIGLLSLAGREDHTLQLRIHLPESAGAVVPYSADLHGGGFDTELPVVRLYLNPGAYFYPYSLLSQLVLSEVGISVDVKGCSDVLVYNQLGQMSANGQFNPFGSIPAMGDYLIVGNYEAARKQLTDFEVKIEWAGLPLEMNGFEEYYRAYGMDFSNSTFKARLSVLRDGRWAPHAREDHPETGLFVSADVESDAKSNRVDRLRRISFAGLCGMSRPLEHASEADYAYRPNTRGGFFRLELSNPPQAFGHKLYPSVLSKALTEQARLSGFGIFKWWQRAKRSRMARRVLPRRPAIPRQYKRIIRFTKMKPLPKRPVPADPNRPAEPYTPLVRNLTVSYRAETSLKLRNISSTEDGFHHIRLFHLQPFGMESLFTRTHGKIRLVPRFEQDGNLFIGLSATRLSGMLTLMFQMLEDSMPEASDESFDFSWHYLAGNTWKRLDRSRVVSDTTHGFLSSGIVTLDIPADIGRGGSVMPGELYWLRLSADGSHLHTLCSLRALHAQAVRVTWQRHKANSFAHLDGALPAGSIREARFTIPGIQKIRQPMDSFGGAMREAREQRMVRVSERLRHKSRAVTPWDFERLILQRFPEIYKVKCFPCMSGRPGEGDKPVPGSLLIVVIPVLPESDSLNMQPMVNALVLREVKEFVAGLASSFSDIQVRNPAYEQIQVRCKVRLRSNPGRKMQHNELNRKIVDYLSPWKPHGLKAKFGWRISCNDVHAFIQELDLVDGVSGLSLLHIVEEDGHLFKLGDTGRQAAGYATAADVQATHPWSIAIPARQHLIDIVDDTRAWKPEATGVSRLSIGGTFILSRGEA